MTKNNHHTTVSLVLGSGGARGLAHIGIIKWLIDNGYEIQSIAGSSIGALIGGIYAAGEMEVYANWVKALQKMDVIRLLDISFMRKSLFKGDRVIEVLREMIGEYKIEDLPISYTAVATDLYDQQEVWLNHGPLFDAIRASIAIPTIFSPYSYMGKYFLDGSLVNPIPIAPTLNDKTDLTIAVDLNGKVQSPVTRTNSWTKGISQIESDSSEKAEKYHQRILQFINGLQPGRQKPIPRDTSLYEIIAKSMDTMQGKIARFQLANYSPDTVIVIPSNACLFYEFYRANELIDIGYQKAEQYLSSKKVSKPLLSN